MTAPADSPYRINIDPALKARLDRVAVERAALVEAELGPTDRPWRRRILDELHRIYGEQRGLNFSKSIHVDGFGFFAALLDRWSEGSGRREFAFLEVGSFEGVSMAVVGCLARERELCGPLVSVDPYLAAGYVEGHPQAGVYRKASDDNTRRSAERLYERLELPVEMLVEQSTTGLARLVGRGARFDLVYVDGLHNGLTPVHDIGMSLSLLADGGLLVLDDWAWPDIHPIKNICDAYLDPVLELPEMVAYHFERRHLESIG